jgi:hypothetical protein
MKSGCTPGYLDQRRPRGWEAVQVVSVRRFHRCAYPLRIATGAGNPMEAGRNGSAIAVVEVTDLIRESDVVGMRRPDDASFL